MFFEQAKVARGMEKLPDGITHAPIFLIRNLLRELPAFYLNQSEAKRGELKPGELMPADQFYRTMAASYASRRDLKLTSSRTARARNFQKCYQRLIAAAGPYEKTLRQVVERSSVINYEHRMTGNGVIHVVTEIMKAKEKLTQPQLQSALDRFIYSQVLVPGQWKPIQDEEIASDSPVAALLHSFQEELEECKETV